MSELNDSNIILITGTSKGIGKFLVEYYTGKGHQVIGCSRSSIDYQIDNYYHLCLDIADEKAVKDLFLQIRKRYKRLDILINNAGIASMNHAMLTPLKTVQKILNTNFVGTFLFCREAAKLMKKNRFGRIVNFSTVAVPLKLKGEAIYAASKAAVVTLSQILACEFADFGITVNAVGPAPTQTNLIQSVPRQKIDELVGAQAIKRFCEFEDIANVIDFFTDAKSDFVTGQTIYLGGV